jgi:GMP synthase (glutamine-hydrolysing)
LIAQAIGGNVYKGRKKEIGWSNVILNHTGYNDLFKGINTNRIKVFQWHGDTFNLPPKATIMAYSKSYPQARPIPHGSKWRDDTEVGEGV